MSDPVLIQGMPYEASAAKSHIIAPAIRRKAISPEAHARFAGTPRWLVTFADLVALLVAFFVMILSMSSFEPDAVARLNGATAGAGEATRASTPATGKALTPETDISGGAGARYAASVLLGQLAMLGVDKGVVLSTNAEGVVLVLPRTALGNDETGREVRAVLSRLADAAPGRITLFGAAVIGDAASLYDAARITATGGDTDLGVGAAGWLAQGQVAIAIRNPSSTTLPASGGRSR